MEQSNDSIQTIGSSTALLVSGLVTTSYADITPATNTINGKLIIIGVDQSNFRVYPSEMTTKSFSLDGKQGFSWTYATNQSQGSYPGLLIQTGTSPDASQSACYLTANTTYVTVDGKSQPQTTLAIKSQPRNGSCSINGKLVVTFTGQDEHTAPVISVSFNSSNAN